MGRYAPNQVDVSYLHFGVFQMLSHFPKPFFFYCCLLKIIHHYFGNKCVWDVS